MAAGGLGGVGGVLVLDELLLSLELPPTHPALVAVPVEPGGRDLTPGHAGLVGWWVLFCQSIITISLSLTTTITSYQLSVVLKYF